MSIRIRLTVDLFEEDFETTREPRGVTWSGYYDRAEAELDKAVADAKVWIASQRPAKRTDGEGIEER